MNQYVIIGNGVAATGCIEGIRSLDEKSSITVISEEPYPVYCRPLISYYLEGKTDLAKMDYRSLDFYESNNCHVLYGKKAIHINKEERTVLLDDHHILPYSSLCLATGSSPFIPKMKGYESIRNKFTFLTKEDALSLQKVLTKDSRVLIIGAGLIGLKCAVGIFDQVHSITICDLAPRILSSILDAESSNRVKQSLENLGIQFMLEDTVVEFKNNTALMRNGQTVDFDILIVAVGVSANIDLLKEIGGKTNKGILIDNSMQTSGPNIYAAGDCTEGYDISFEDKRILALMPNAYMQGKCAGINMAGGKSIFDNAIPMNSIGLFGAHIMTAGTYYNPSQGGEIYSEHTDDSMKKLFIKDGILTGFILIGDVKNAGIYTSLIRERTPLASLSIEKIMQKPSLLAFAEEKRSKILGGDV